MIQNLKIIRVDVNYCDFLRKFDNKVSYNKLEEKCLEYNKQGG